MASYAELSRQSGINAQTIAARIHRGMSREDALKPTRQYRKMDIELVRKLAADGHKCIGIAYVLDRSESYICTYCKKHKIKIGKQK
jgi:hypothetical protein